MKPTIKSHSDTRLSILFVAVVILFAVVAAYPIATVDPTFKPVPSTPITITSGFSGMSQEVQPDGKILVWGRR